MGFQYGRYGDEREGGRESTRCCFDERNRDGAVGSDPWQRMGVRGCTARWRWRPGRRRQCDLGVTEEGGDLRWAGLQAAGRWSKHLGWSRRK
jgi:hypothetical protein